MLSIKKRTRPLLIYILGWGRSGSSVLANVIGSMPGAASLGEVRYIWDRGVLDNTICGCGEKFHDCEFWSGAAFENVSLGQMPRNKAQELTETIGSGGRPGQVPGVYSELMRNRYFKKNGESIDALMKMYEDIFERSGCNVIVDSSKSPFYALNFLDQKRDFDVMFLHLTRDPRAVLHSWRKKKKREEGGSAQYFPRYSTPRSLMQWRFVNVSCEQFSHFAPKQYVHMKYEDFATDWAESLMSSAPDVFERAEQVMSAEGATVTSQHSISGNPSRFNTGNIKIELDTSWESQLRDMDNILAQSFAGRVAKRYGYAIK